MSGITVEYKRSDEYKEWYSLIKAEHPTLPDLLIDYAIAFHKSNPKAYKEYGKKSDNRDILGVRGPKQTHFTVDDAVKVYDPDEAPKADVIKVVEN
jgi:hypothetical protein